jgi:hypothetical protein
LAHFRYVRFTPLCVQSKTGRGATRRLLGHFGRTNPIFIDENGGGFGVRMRKRQSVKKHKHPSDSDIVSVRSFPLANLHLAKRTQFGSSIQQFRKVGARRPRKHIIGFGRLRDFVKWRIAHLRRTI